MSRLLLCVGRVAEIPYRFIRLDREIYSVEELCHLLTQSAFLLDDDFPEDGLIQWLSSQCGLDALAGELKVLKRDKSSTAEAVRSILEYVRYNTREEIERAVGSVSENAGRGVYEKRASRADHFLREGRLLRALAEYEEMEEQFQSVTDQMKGAVLHNKGVICARLLLFDRAEEYFGRAYELSGNSASYLGLLAARRLGSQDRDYVDYVAEHPESYGLSMELEARLNEAADMYDTSDDNLRVRAMALVRSEGRKDTYTERMDRELDSLREEYRGFIR